MEGERTKAPPRAPTRISTRPLASRTRSASRTVTRLTPKCSQSSRSAGSRSPGCSWPCRMSRRIWSTMIPEMRPGLIRLNSPADASPPAARPASARPGAPPGRLAPAVSFNGRERLITAPFCPVDGGSPTAYGMINRPLAGPLLPRNPGRRHGRSVQSLLRRLASSVASQSWCFAIEVMCTDGCRPLHLLCTRAFGLHEVDHALCVQAPVRTARPSMSASSPDAAPVIDVHAHLVPERAFERVPAGMRAERVEGPDEIRLVVHGPRGAGRGAPPELRDLELHRRRQERRGIGLSLLGPWVDMVKAPDEARLQQAWCRVLNEELAAATGPTDHSRWLAALPDLDGARAGQELEWAAAAGAVGGMLAANPEHGTLARGDLVGNPFETTLAAGSLLAAGVPERHPDLEVVLVHGGGFLPYQYARMAAGFERWPRLRELQRRSPAGLLRWFHYDTVLFADPPTRYLLELVGDDRVMAGSDCPFTMTDTRPFEAPERLGLDQAGRDRVLGGNAARLFRLHEPAGAER